MHSDAGRGTHTSHTRGYGWTPLSETWAQHEGLTLLPPAIFSLSSPAAGSVEKAELWHRCCATPVSAPAEDGCRAGHWVIWIYAEANLASGLSSPCCTQQHIYPTKAFGIWDLGWKHQGWMGRIDGELRCAPLVVKEVCFWFVPPPSRIEGPHVIPEVRASKVPWCLDTPTLSDAPVLSPGIQLTDTLEQMQQGTLMRKVKSKSWKKQRYFKLQEDCMTIWYQSKRTGKTESACEYQLLCAGREAISRFQSEQGCEGIEILGLAKGAGGLKKGSTCMISSHPHLFMKHPALSRTHGSKGLSRNCS